MACLADLYADFHLHLRNNLRTGDTNHTYSANAKNYLRLKLIQSFHQICMKEFWGKKLKISLIMAVDDGTSLAAQIAWRRERYCDKSVLWWLEPWSQQCQLHSEKYTTIYALNIALFFTKKCETHYTLKCCILRTWHTEVLEHNIGTKMHYDAMQ